MINETVKEDNKLNYLYERWSFLLTPFHGPISGSTLKIVAIVSMAIDHFAAAVLYFLIFEDWFPPETDLYKVYDIYLFLRGVGRTAFPIYCFLLTEGLIHTRSRVRYAGSLLLFALISEIPFDLAITFDISDPASLNLPMLIETSLPEFMEHQNTFFTLFIGLLTCWGIEELRRRIGMHPVTFISAAALSAAGIALAQLLKTDYAGIGVATILCFYFLKPFRIPALGAAFFMITRYPLEVWCFPGFLLMLFYNGKRGFLGRTNVVKYFFYAFYPLHFTLYVILRVLMLR